MEIVSELLRFIIVAGVAGLALYLSLFLFDRLTANLREWQEVANGNTAVGLVMAGVVLAVAIVLRPILALPVQNMDLGGARIAVNLLVDAVRVVAGMLLATFSVAFTAWLFDKLTPWIDEKKELAKNNIAVGAIQAAVIIGAAVLFSIPAANLTEAILNVIFH